MARNPSTELAAFDAQSFEGVGRWEGTLHEAQIGDFELRENGDEPGLAALLVGSLDVHYLTQHHGHYADFVHLPLIER
jgi:hypothetical protein